MLNHHYDINTEESTMPQALPSTKYDVNDTQCIYIFQQAQQSNPSALHSWCEYWSQFKTVSINKHILL